MLLRHQVGVILCKVIFVEQKGLSDGLLGLLEGVLVSQSFNVLDDVK